MESEFRHHLQSELSRRCRTNPRYSLRSFARYLDLDPSSVSQLLAGKRQASRKMEAKIYGKIGAPPPADSTSTERDYHVLSQDVFAVIADWYHYVILDLTLLPNFRDDSRWISRRLGITAAEAKMALERLHRLGMLVKKNGKTVKAASHYANFKPGETSSAHKEYQRQIVRKAMEAIDACPQEKKDITCITIAADSAKLPEARRKIQNFRRGLCDFMEAGTGDSVYVLAMQLIPLTND